MPTKTCGDCLHLRAVPPEPTDSERVCVEDIFAVTRLPDTPMCDKFAAKYGRYVLKESVFIKHLSLGCHILHLGCQDIRLLNAEVEALFKETV